MKRKTEHFQYISNDMSQMSDNMCISCPPTAVLAYWDPGGLASFINVKYFVTIWTVVVDCTFYIKASTEKLNKNNILDWNIVNF